MVTTHMRWHLLIYIQFIFYLKRSRGKSEFSKLGGEPLTFRLLWGCWLGETRKIRELKTGSRTYDLLITSSNADSRKLRKIRVLETRSRLLVRILTRGKLKKIRVLKSSRAKPLTLRFLVRMLYH